LSLQPHGAAAAVVASGGAPRATDTAGITQAFAVASAQTAPPQPPSPPRHSSDGDSMFLSLFRTDGSRGAVSPAVTQLWGRGNAAMHAGTATSSSATAFAPSAALPSGDGGLLNLFQDMPPKMRGLFESE
jgi:hypothetical protein